MEYKKVEKATKIALDYIKSRQKIRQFNRKVACPSEVPTTERYGLEVPTEHARCANIGDIIDITNSILSREAATTLDRASHAALDQTNIVFGPTDFVISATHDKFDQIKNNHSLNFYHVEQIAKEMERLGIPPCVDGFYVAIGKKKSFSSILHYLEPTPCEINLNGSLGVLGNVVFVISSSMSRHRCSIKGDYDEVLFLGKDPVIEKIVSDVEISTKMPQDFGKMSGVIWQYKGEFSLNYTGKIPHAVKWESFDAVDYDLMIARKHKKELEEILRCSEGNTTTRSI